MPNTLQGTKVQGERVKVQVGHARRMFFTQRVAVAWNTLPVELEEAGTLATFKRDRDGIRIGRESRDIDQVMADGFAFS